MVGSNSLREIHSNPPLEGRKILLTRTREGNIVLKKKLEQLGASVVDFPSIEIHPPSNLEQLDKAIKSVSEFDWILFTSASGVRTFFKRLREKSGGSVSLVARNENKRFAKVKFACIGPGTATALKEEAGIEASFVPKNFLTENLALELCEKFDVRSKKILIVRAENAERRIGPIFSEHGADKVMEVSSYRTSPTHGGNGYPQIEVNGVTDVTFASPSSVDSLVKAGLSGEDLRKEEIAVHCIGPVTAKRALERGFRVNTVAKVHTIDGLVQAIVEYYTSKPNPTQTIR
jgi:uroporphyrinogen-III synthase